MPHSFKIGNQIYPSTFILYQLFFQLRPFFLIVFCLKNRQFDYTVVKSKFQFLHKLTNTLLKKIYYYTIYILTYIFNTRSKVSLSFFRLSFNTFSFKGGGCITLYSKNRSINIQKNIIHYNLKIKQSLTHLINLFHFFDNLRWIFAFQNSSSYQLSLLFILF